MKITIIALLIIATLIIIINHTNKQTQNQFKLLDCIDKTSLEQRFTGTPKQKWDLFAEYCIKDINK